MKNEVAVFAGGCFWCTEAIFQRIRGVKSVLPGYTGGHVEYPTYEQVVDGDTGHAEVTRVQFNPEEVRFEDLLEVFWHTHDPTSVNRQGNDVGPQYRSAIFTTTDEQFKKSWESKQALEKSGEFSNPIVTEIEPLSAFYEAEDYHQKYFENHPNAPYCQLIIVPKLEKLLSHYKNLVK